MIGGRRCEYCRRDISHLHANSKFCSPPHKQRKYDFDARVKASLDAIGDLSAEVRLSNSRKHNAT